MVASICVKATSVRGASVLVAPARPVLRTHEQLLALWFAVNITNRRRDLGAGREFWRKLVDHGHREFAVP